MKSSAKFNFDINIIDQGKHKKLLGKNVVTLLHLLLNIASWTGKHEDLLGCLGMCTSA